MYLSRTGNIQDIILWFILSGIWGIGGWLISVNLFRLRSRERLFSGISIGLFLFILLSSILGRILLPEFTYWSAALIILVFGIILALRNHETTNFPIKDFFVYSQIIGFFFLFFLFTLINFGLAIFDDYSNLPLTSLIATGDIPPHFFLNPEIPLDYHFGMHILSASMVNIGGLYPWIALDITKSLSISLSIIIGWLWFRRYIRSDWSWLWISILILFADGSRWLLLFLPVSVLEKIGKNLSLLGSAHQTGSNLYEALINPWAIQGGGPISFPFAFLSGMSGTTTFAMGGNSALPILSVFLLLLLARKSWKPLQGLIFGSIIASLLIISEQHYMIIWIGLSISLLIFVCNQRTLDPFINHLSVLLPSISILPFIGGSFTITLQRYINQLIGQSTPSSIMVPSFAFRVPPSFLSAHLGTLAITDIGQFLIAICEIGPLVSLAPFSFYLLKKSPSSNKFLISGLSIMAIISFLFPIFIRFTERERDLSRFTGTATSIWLILALPYLWYAYKRGSKKIQTIFLLIYFITIFGGLALFPIQLVAIASPQASYFIQEPDILMTRKYWNQLEVDAKILDMNYVYRPAALFGRTTTKAYENVYTPFPEFITLTQNPDPTEISRAGYTYVYMDRKTWKNLNEENKSAFKKSCVKLIQEERASDGDFRRLLDIQNCSTED